MTPTMSHTSEKIRKLLNLLVNMTIKWRSYRCIVITNFQDEKDIRSTLTMYRLLYTKRSMSRRKTLLFNYMQETLAMHNKNAHFWLLSPNILIHSVWDGNPRIYCLSKHAQEILVQRFVFNLPTQ